LFSEKLTTDATNLDIKPREAVAVFVYYKDNVTENKKINEVPYYAPEICKEFATSSTFTINVPSVSDIEYAYLRIGVGRIAGTNRNLKVNFNGIDLTVPMEKCATRLENSAGYGSTKIIQVDKSLVKNTNTIVCSFDDGKMGGIGAVTLLTGINQELTKLDKVESGNELEFSISPNPASENVTISFNLPKESNIQLTLYDAAGKEFKTIARSRLTEGKHQFSVNTTSFSPGVCVCKLTTDNTVYSKKMMVVN
jgi:hypothetical protein